MRKIFLVSAIILAECSYSLAQENNLKDIYTDITTKINSALLTRKSSIELSGFLSYNYFNTKFDNGESYKRHLLQAEPILSYFIIDDLSLGLNFSYHYDKIESGAGKEISTTEQKFLGPIIKFYFCDEKFRPFLFADYLFLAGDDFDGGELGMGAGIMVHVSGNLGVNLRCKYGRIWSDQDDIDTQNTIFVGFGLSNFIF